MPAITSPIAHPRRTAVRATACAASLGAALLLLAGCSDAVTTPAPADAPAASAVTADRGLATLAWQRTAQGLVAKYAASALLGARVYSLVSVARYAAVVDAEQGEGRRDFEAERGAVAGASAAVLASFYPAEARSLEAMVLAQGEEGPGRTHPHYTRGVEIGEAAAAQVLARAATDGYTTPWTGTVPVGPGLWLRLAPPAGVQLPGMKPFFLTSGSQFRPGPPPAFGSPEYQSALDAVRYASDHRTTERDSISRYWGISAITTAGQWGVRAAGLIEAAGLDEREASHVLALMDATMIDASIACFDAKYTYWFIRPSHADPAIKLPVGLPSHPSYPSGHSCVSGSAAGVLASVFPAAGPALMAEVAEAGQSRFYAGLHYQFDILDGQKIGRQAAETALEFDRTRGLLSAIR